MDLQRSNIKPNIIVIMILLLSSQIQALESDQISTIVYKEQFQMISPEIWIKGVESSNNIFDKVKKKINNIGTQLNNLLKEHASLLIRNKVEAIAYGQMLMENNENTEEDGLVLAVLNDFKKLLPDLSYTCPESEQLYGVAYGKVYETCKNGLFFEGISPDWTSCMAIHYPWVDVRKTSICVVKSFSGDFLACFCYLEDGKISKRGFCITKLECSLTQENVIDESHRLIAGEECFNQIQHFLVTNTMNKDDFKTAQMKDNLRVRPPYHPESSCNQTQFVSFFDIGQVDIENIKAGMMVYTPGYKNVFEKVGENEITELDSNLLAEVEALINLFELRIAVSIISWIPGVAFIFLTRIKDPNKMLRSLTHLSQMFVVSSGIYNFILSCLPLGSHQESQTILILIPIPVYFIFYKKENTLFFLKFSLISLLPEMIFCQTCWIILIVQGFWDVIINMYFTMVQFYIIYKLTKTNFNNSEQKKSTKMPDSNSCVKINQKRRKKKQAIQTPNPKEINKECIKTKVKQGKEEKQKKKTSLQSEATIANFKPESRSEQTILGLKSSTQNCSGKIDEIVSDGKGARKRHTRKENVNDSKKIHQNVVITEKISIKTKFEKEHNQKIQTEVYCPELRNLCSTADKFGSEESINSVLKYKVCDETLEEDTKSQAGNLNQNNQQTQMTNMIIAGTRHSFSSLDNIKISNDIKNRHISCSSQIGFEKEFSEPNVENKAMKKASLNVELPNNEKHDIDEAKNTDACLPLTRIIYKEVHGYSIKELDRVVNDILSDANSAHLTIPEFKEIVMTKLETEFWPDGIYISDNEDEDDIQE